MSSSFLLELNGVHPHKAQWQDLDLNRTKQEGLLARVLCTAAQSWHGAHLEEFETAGEMIWD